MDGILYTDMKTFVIGDIHGAYKALRQCLERCDFDYHHDRLIVLGDICDGYPQVHLCIDELLKIKHCSYIVGNHDLWALDWALRGSKPEIWTSQGGTGTINSYEGEVVPREHIHFLQTAYRWYIWQEKLFVHGGFSPEVPIEQQKNEKFVWDRLLIENAWKKSLENNDYKFSQYEEIFLGHTPTKNFGGTVPMRFCNIWAMDTGAGWYGPLTIMNVNSKEYWQSDTTSTLYPNYVSR